MTDTQAGPQWGSWVIQWTCGADPRFAHARTAAHNQVWQAITSALKQTLQSTCSADPRFTAMTRLKGGWGDLRGRRDGASGERDLGGLLRWLRVVDACDVCDGPWGTGRARLEVRGIGALA